MDRFSGRYWTVGNEYTNAFSQVWNEDLGFFHPPLSELARVMEKIERDGGVVVIPDWPGSEMDSIMIQASVGVELKGIRRVSFDSPEWKKDDIFRGTPAFGMRVYEWSFEYMESL